MPQVATAVGEAAFKDGVAQIERPDDLEAYMADRMWCAAPAARLLLSNQPSLRRHNRHMHANGSIMTVPGYYCAIVSVCCAQP